MTASKNLSVGMHLDVYKPVWFKRRMVIDDIELYSLIVNSVILTLIQGHKGARKQKLLRLLAKILINLHGIGCLGDLLI